MVWSFVGDLNTPVDSFAVKARLIRVYGIPTFNRRDVATVECLFHDEKEDRFEASIPRTVARSYRDELEEGKIYGLSNLKVVLDIRAHKLTSCRYRMFFTDHTQVLKLVVKDFPDKQFNFKSFSDVYGLATIENIPAFDVIGSLAKVGDVSTLIAKTGSKKRLIDILLQDAEGGTLSCTLWEGYVDKFQSLMENDIEDPKILVVQLCKPTDYKTERRISNTFYATKLWLNAPMAEVDAFKRSLREASSLDTTIYNSMSQGATQEFDDEYIHGTTKTMEIVDLFNVDEGWSYVACEKCRKKLSKVDTQYYCERCNDYDSLPSLRYKLSMQVRDNTGFVQLLVWDKDCCQTIGKSAADLQRDSALKPSNDPEAMILAALLEKEFCFRIHRKKSEQPSVFGGGYTVVKISPSAECKMHYPENQESNSINKLGETTLVDTPSSKAPLGVGLTNSSPSNSTPPHASTTAETSGEWCDDGRVKRSLDEAFSTANTRPRTRVHIKKEKK